MPFDYKIEDSYVSVGLYGVVTVSDLYEMAQRYREFELEKGLVPSRIVDLSRAEEIQINFAQCDNYAAMVRTAKWKNKAKAAIVATNQLHFGLARMFQTMAENSQVEVGIFPESKAAVQWILGKDSPLGKSMPNQSSDPTLSSVTPPAGQEPRPR